jgi:hypothetical protein
METPMSLKSRAGSKRSRWAMPFVRLSGGLLLAATTTLPAVAQSCRPMPDGRLMMMSGPFADDVAGPCPEFQGTPPPRQAIQPALPTTRFTTGTIGPFTTGDIGPRSTFSSAPTRATQHR